MGMFFAPLKLNVYFPVLTYDRGVWSMLITKDGGYHVQKPMLICFSEKWTFLRLKTGRKDLFSDGTFVIAVSKFLQHSASPFTSQH